MHESCGACHIISSLMLCHTAITLCIPYCSLHFVCRYTTNDVQVQSFSGPSLPGYASSQVQVRSLRIFKSSPSQLRFRKKWT